MTYLVCYRLKIGKFPIQGDTYAELRRLTPEALEALRSELRAGIIKEATKHNKTAEPANIGKLLFTFIMPMDHGDIPKKKSLTFKTKIAESQTPLSKTTSNQGISKQPTRPTKPTPSQGRSL